MWAAGRAYEAMADISLKAGPENKDTAAKYTSQAVEFFKINGSADKAVNLTLEAARQFNSMGLLDYALRFYDHAMTLLRDAEMYLFGKDVVAAYASLLLEHKLYDQALAVYETEVTFGKALNRSHQVNKAILCILATSLVQTQSLSLVQDKAGTWSGREQSFVLSTESELMTESLVAWEMGDQEKFDKAVRRGAWGVVEVPVSRIQLIRALRQLRVPQPEVRAREEAVAEADDIISQNL